MKRNRRARNVPMCMAAVLLAIMLALACCSCGNGGGARTLDPATVERIDAAVAAAMDAYDAPGALVGVWMGDGASLVKAYGLAGIEPELVMREGMSFRVGSVTKTFTGNLVLQLADQGRLSLEDPVSRFVEGIPDGDRITVRMLLNHSSGLFNYGADTALNETIMTDPHKVWTPRELVDAGITNPPYFPPGEGCMYSNTNYVLLGMIVEKVTGRPFAEELERGITGPLGLGSTYLAEGYELSGDHARGYGADPETGELYDLTEYLGMSIVWSAGAVVSDLGDLGTWGKALAEGWRLSPETRRSMTDGMLDMPGMQEYFGYPMLYGLGIMDVGGWLGHSGMEPGYSSAMFRLPAGQATVVVMLNVSELQEPGMRLFMEVAKILFPEDTPW